MTCDVCGADASGGAPFIVVVSSHALSIKERATVSTTLAGVMCPRCAPRLRRFQILRALALAALAAGIAFCLLTVSWFAGKLLALGPFVALALGALPFAVVAVPLARWHETTAREVLGPELCERLPSLLPSGGVVGWKQIRVLPGAPALDRTTLRLADLRARTGPRSLKEAAARLRAGR